MSLLKMNQKNYRHLSQVFFVGQSYFNNDGGQLYLIFQPIYKTITISSGLNDTILYSKWNCLSKTDMDE